MLIKIFFFNSSKLHLIHLLFVFIIFVYYHHGFVFYEHGMYNILVFLLLLFFHIIIILLFKLIIFIFKIKNKIKRLLKLFIAFLLLLIYKYNFPDIKCDGWEKGLNNTSIENNEQKYGCRIKFPKYCQYKLFSPIQDYTKILGVNCSIKKSNSRDIILKKTSSLNSFYINKNTTKFGFPFTNKDLIGCLDGMDTDIFKR